jgi:hypothetical protein
LGGVHSLYLSWCEGISDVEALGGVHSLHSSEVPGSIDVSALGRVDIYLGLESLFWNQQCECRGRCVFLGFEVVSRH